MRRSVSNPGTISGDVPDALSFQAINRYTIPCPAFPTRLRFITMETPPFVILTCFGIGVIDSTPLLARLQILLSTLKPSLEQQVDPDFVWLVVADANISEDLRAELTEAICDRDNFVLSMVDPTKTLTMDPTRALRGNLPPDASMVIVQRIDDDDLVHPEMVARTKAEYKKALDRSSSLPIAISFPRILEVSLTTLQILERDYPWNQFSSTLSKCELLYTPYNGGPHPQLGASCQQRGGTSLVVDIDQPMYVYMRRPNSVSSIKKKIALSGAQTFSSSCSMQALTKFGLTSERREALRRLMQQETQSSPLFPAKPLKKIQLKTSLLSILKKLDQVGLSNERDRKALMQAFYSL